ncbi:MAG: HAMP domain-containing histidine kinase [Thermodesulfovibrionales bacterium]|nr:HAMP domain-containing histidine kinase [Thermodesulfovibrionales bacterium]
MQTIRMAMLPVRSFEILERIKVKKMTYHHYGFSPIESAAVMTFFDLAQEFESIVDFYYLCVAIPKVFFDFDAGLYLLDIKTGEMSLVSSTLKEFSKYLHVSFVDFSSEEKPFHSAEGYLVLPIRGNELLISQISERVKNGILGYLTIFSPYDLNDHQEFFLQKYANRIGFNIHNRFLFEKNIEHLKFIRSLVADIEHNVIVPNMVFKLFLRRLKGEKDKKKEIERFLLKHSLQESCDGLCLEHIFAELQDVNRGLQEEFQNIDKHYRNTSLFLETLLRRGHFDHGRLVLRTTPCNMKKDVVEPQLDRFREQFKEMGISINDECCWLPDEEVISVVDIGLMAQVYSNLFSNALKYTEEVVDSKGDRRKFIAYGREVIKNFFGEGRDGIKYNVFSTGQHIKEEERDKIFNEGFRGSNRSNKPGSGHGLSFVKNAVEIHGGVVGYEATPLGNNFYFILPR